MRVPGNGSVPLEIDYARAGPNPMEGQVELVPFVPLPMHAAEMEQDLLQLLLGIDLQPVGSTGGPTG